MTLFGWIWLLIIIYSFIQEDIKPMIFTTIFSMIFQCTNMIYIEGFLSCGPQIITSILFIVKSYLYKDPINCNQIDNNKVDKYKKFILIFGIYIILGAIINGLTMNLSFLLNCSIIIIYQFAFYRMMKFSNLINDRDIENIVKYLTIIILFFGFFQMIVGYFDLPRNNLIGMLFYNDNMDTNIFYYKDSYRFYSLFMEPSYCAGLLSAILVYYLFKKEKDKYDIIKIILVTLAIILSRSSTAYITFSIIVGIYILINIKKKSTWIMIIGIVIVGLYLLLFTDLINEVLINKLNSPSGRVRLSLDRYAFSQFIENPIFGIGYKQIRASSILIDLLCEFGIVGTILYSIPFSYIIYILIKQKNLYEKKYNLMVSSMLISMLIACPDIDLCTFWLVMYIFALSFGLNAKTVEDSKEKKIGILTYHRALNYGAVLQTYALYKKLTNLTNQKVEIINYYNKSIESGRNITTSGKISLTKLVKYPYILLKSQKFDNFLKEVSQSAKIEDNLPFYIEKNYDRVIVGSDQVWNFNINNSDYAYLFKGTKNVKKYSYAASFGITNYDKKTNNNIKRLLKKFDAISVREKTGCQFLSEKLNIKKSVISLDPTLLLSGEEWKNLVDHNNQKSDYILIYNVPQPSLIEAYAQKLSEEKNMDIIFIPNGYKPKIDCKIIRPNVYEFISLFKNAKYVITNSFHGTVFSILLKKKFLVEYNGKSKLNDRIENLLNICKLEHCILNNETALSDIDKEIDWNIVDSKLDKERQKSIKYLENIVNGDNKNE